MTARQLLRTLALPIAVSLGGCGSADDPVKPTIDAGQDTAPAPTVITAGPGEVRVTVSGEKLALGGIPYPATGDDPVIVDGWSIKLDRVLVTVANVTLSDNPDRSPSDPSQTGAAVARVDGPFAVDLHKGGPVAGKGGSSEQALPLAIVANQTLNGGAAFDPTVRYALGYEVVAASATAKRVGFDADDDAAYQKMIAKGWTVLYVGTATFAGTGCQSTDATYDFGKLPTSVPFELGFASPTAYTNCQNPDNDPAKPLSDEEHERGVLVRANRGVDAQLTIHLDHPFWEALVHDAAFRFDHYAARLVGQPAHVLTLDDLAGVNPLDVRDGAGAPLPWRWCVSGYAPPSNGQMILEVGTLQVDPKGDPTRTLRDLRDYATYIQSTQGHLNADGLCFVRRKYASPP
jgi:hypothetical protein